MGKYVAFEKKKHHLTKKDGWFIFAIVILSALLLVSGYLLYTNAIYKTRIESIGQITIGTPVKIQIDGVGSFSQAVSFYGASLPDMPVEQQGFLSVQDNVMDLVLRAKVFIHETDESPAEEMFATFTTDFVKNETDGFYYYKNVLKSNVVLKFMQEIRLPDAQMDLISTQLYDFIITLETLPANSDYLSIWNVVSGLQVIIVQPL